MTVDAFEKRLLRGLAFADVASIDSLSLESIRDMLLAGQTGFEYRPPVAVSGISSSVSEKELLTGQYQKKKMALDRLKALYLYGDSGISEQEYITERDKIIADLEMLEKKLSAIKVDDSDSLISSEDFLQRASYFVMIEHLLDEKYINYENFTKTIDRSIQRSFFLSVIDKIVITSGKVTSIAFKNGITSYFTYK